MIAMAVVFPAWNVIGSSRSSLCASKFFFLFRYLFLSISRAEKKTEEAEEVEEDYDAS